MSLTPYGGLADHLIQERDTMDKKIKGLTAITIEINKRKGRSDVYLDPNSLIMRTTSGRTPPRGVALAVFKIGRCSWGDTYTKEEVAKTLQTYLVGLGYIGYAF